MKNKNVISETKPLNCV